jgi:hypothetical protein
MIDLFQFTNVYAPTSDISALITDPDMFRECQAYVYYPPEPTIDHHRMPSQSSQRSSSGQMQMATSSFSSSSSSFSSRTNSGVPSQAFLFSLYKSLHQGQTVREWCLEHRKVLQGIDVRRFLTFGVIKGLIYRIYSYPVGEFSVKIQQARNRRLSKKVELQRSLRIPGTEDRDSDSLDDFTDALREHPQHFDFICTELAVPKKEAEELLQTKGDWIIINA